MAFLEYIEQLSQDQLIYFAVPVFLIAMVIEYFIAKEKYYVKDTGVSLLMMVFSGIVEFIPKILAFIAFFYLHEWSPLKDIVEPSMVGLDLTTFRR